MPGNILHRHKVFLLQPSSVYYACQLLEQVPILSPLDILRRSESINTDGTLYIVAFIYGPQGLPLRYAKTTMVSLTIKQTCLVSHRLFSMISLILSTMTTHCLFHFSLSPKFWSSYISTFCVCMYVKVGIHVPLFHFDLFFSCFSPSKSDNEGSNLQTYPMV